MKRSSGLLAMLLAGLVLGGTAALAFPGDLEGPASVLAAKPRKKGSPVPQQKDQGDEEGEVGEPPGDQKTMECMAQCQQPAMRCLGKCGQDSKCSARCAERMTDCGRKCGLKTEDS